MLRTQPTRSPLTEPWFEACNRGELLIQRCKDCGAYQFYPRTLCTQCDSTSLEWVAAQGTASIASYTVVRHAVSPAFEVPYVVALVDLEEGPRLMTNIVNTDPDSLEIGMPVTLGFERWDDDTSMPVFTVVGNSQSEPIQQVEAK